MGRSPCCEKVGLKKGPWTPEEDQKLLAYIEEHGHGSWRALPAKAGLQRCGKSCRLRWTNYLRPDIKRGKFSLQEEQTIIQLHALLGNRWSVIATHLPKRTDNEIKNHWNTHLKKRLTKMGIDPVTHKPKSYTFGGSGGRNPKDVANLSHMAQWESARLEAEARLVRESKLVSKPYQNQLSSSALAQLLFNKVVTPPVPPCLDVLKAWQGVWFNSTKDSAVSGFFSIPDGNLESPMLPLKFSEKTLPIPTVGFSSNSVAAAMEFTGSFSTCNGGISKEGENDWKYFGKSNHLTEDRERLDNSVAWHDMTYNTEGLWINGNVPLSNFVEGLTDLLFENNDDRNSSDTGEISDNAAGSYGGVFEDHKNYWNSIFSLVNSPPSDSPVF